MSKYTYDYEEWSQDTRFYTVECDRKLTRDEVQFTISEVDLDYEDIEQNIPLDDGAIAIVTYHGNEWGASNCELTEGEEDLKDD
jgi:hypothetical protein